MKSCPPMAFSHVRPHAGVFRRSLMQRPRGAAQLALLSAGLAVAGCHESRCGKDGASHGFLGDTPLGSQCASAYEFRPRHVVLGRPLGRGATVSNLDAPGTDAGGDSAASAISQDGGLPQERVQVSFVALSDGNGASDHVVVDLVQESAQGFNRAVVLEGLPSKPEAGKCTQLSEGFLRCVTDWNGVASFSVAAAPQGAGSVVYNAWLASDDGQAHAGASASGPAQEGDASTTARGTPLDTLTVEVRGLTRSPVLHCSENDACHLPARLLAGCASTASCAAAPLRILPLHVSVENEAADTTLRALLSMRASANAALSLRDDCRQESSEVFVAFRGGTVSETAYLCAHGAGGAFDITATIDGQQSKVLATIDPDWVVQAEVRGAQAGAWAEAPGDAGASDAFAPADGSSKPADADAAPEAGSAGLDAGSAGLEAGSPVDNGLVLTPRQCPGAPPSDAGVTATISVGSPTTPGACTLEVRLSDTEPAKKAEAALLRVQSGAKVRADLACSCTGEDPTAPSSAATCRVTWPNAPTGYPALELQITPAGDESHACQFSGGSLP